MRGSPHEIRSLGSTFNLTCTWLPSIQAASRLRPSRAIAPIANNSSRLRAASPGFGGRGTGLGGGRPETGRTAGAVGAGRTTGVGRASGPGARGNPCRHLAQHERLRGPDDKPVFVGPEAAIAGQCFSPSSIEICRADRCRASAGHDAVEQLQRAAVSIGKHAVWISRPAVDHAGYGRLGAEADREPARLVVDMHDRSSSRRSAPPRRAPAAGTGGAPRPGSPVPAPREIPGVGRARQEKPSRRRWCSSKLGTGYAFCSSPCTTLSKSAKTCSRATRKPSNSRILLSRTACRRASAFA